MTPKQPTKKRGIEAVTEPKPELIVNIADFARRRLRNLGGEAAQLRRLLGVASDAHCPACGRKYRDTDEPPPEQRAS